MESAVPDRASSIATPPALEAKRAALCRAGTYPHGADRFEAIETHMSWVFLVGEYAYKLKKPVRYDFLDFSTPALRERNCREEVRLNRRLAPDVYLGVVPLVLDGAGDLRIGVPGETVDWLVQMRRLPRGKMLDRAIIAHEATAADAARIAAILAPFYRSLPPALSDPKEYRRRLVLDVLDSARHLESPQYGLPTSALLSAVTRTFAFAAHHSDLIDARVAAGRIVEGHGDLRPEHFCMLEPPVVIDCLEFNPALRVTDVAAELASLAVECEHLGAPDFAADLMERTFAALGDEVPSPLLHYYIAQRALLRFKLLQDLLGSRILFLGRSVRKPV